MILGIDPGLDGAFVWLRESGQFSHAEIMPTLKNGGKRQVEAEGILDILKSRPTRLCVIEQAETRPLLAAQAVLTTGRNYGLILGILTALEIPYEVVLPRQWTREMHEPFPQNLKPKAKSLLCAQRLFPKVPLIREGCRVPHDGIVDALLIAEYGWRHHGH